MLDRRRLAGLACFGLSLHALPIENATAQSYPSRPIRMVVPSSPGGGNDINARILAPTLAEMLGVSVLIDNRAGGGTVIGTDIVAKASADGYTLLMASFEFATNPSLVRKLPYDTLKDFTPVAQTVSSQYVLTTRSNVPVTSVKELIAFGKTRPSGLNFGAPNLGSAGHLAGGLLQMMTGTQVVQIPFKGAGPATIGLMSGEVDFMFGSTSTAVAQVKAGKLRAIAVTGLRRFSGLPEVPTMSEQGLPEFVVTGWFGVLAPTGTPRAIIGKLNAEIVKAAQHPASRERFTAVGTEPRGGSPAEFGAFLSSEIEKWSRVIKSAGLRLD